MSEVCSAAFGLFRLSYPRRCRVARELGIDPRGLTDGEVIAAVVREAKAWDGLGWIRARVELDLRRCAT